MPKYKFRINEVNTRKSETMTGKDGAETERKRVPWSKHFESKTKKKDKINVIYFYTLTGEGALVPKNTTEPRSF